MTREQLIENFAESMEKERIALGYSQAQMAQALDMSLSTYKRIINVEITKLDFYTFYQLYQLTGKFAFELCKYEDPLSNTVASMRRLSHTQLRTINAFIDFEDHFASTLNSGQNVEDYTTLIIPSGCMHDGMIYDSCLLSKINIAPYRRRFHDKIDCAILITSSHLNPTYNVNDIPDRPQSHSGWGHRNFSPQRNRARLYSPFSQRTSMPSRTDRLLRTHTLCRWKRCLRNIQMDQIWAGSV